MPASFKIGAIGPERLAANFRRMVERLGRMPANTSHDRFVGSAPRRARARGLVSNDSGNRGPCPRALEDGSELPSTLSPLSPGDGSPLDRDATDRRVARQFLAALDDRGMHRASAQDRMAFSREELSPWASSATRKCPALAMASTPRFRPRAMRGAPFDDHIEPDEAFMSECELEMARLCDDGRIRLEMARDLGRAEAGIFLIRHAGDEDVSRKTLFRGPRGRDHHGGDPALHVEGAAAEELSAFPLRRAAGRHRIRHA